MFNRKAGKVSEFLIAYKLYIKTKINEAAVEKQI